MSRASRARSRPDRRLDWRDPEMPCLREYKVEDADCNIIERGMDEVRPQEVSQVATQDLGETGEPSWRNDPSYFWGRSRSSSVQRS